MWWLLNEVWSAQLTVSQEDPEIPRWDTQKRKGKSQAVPGLPFRAQWHPPLAWETAVPEGGSATRRPWCLCEILKSIWLASGNSTLMILIFPPILQENNDGKAIGPLFYTANDIAFGPLPDNPLFISFYLCREEMVQSSGSQSGVPRLGAPASGSVIWELLQMGMGQHLWV